jgi:Zn-dependent protease with chaperone function
MILALIAALLAAGIALPHFLDLRRAPAMTASLIWAGGLALRALAGAALIAYVVLVFPATGLFSAVTHWCWHTVLPVLTTHLGFDGHRLGGVVVLLPAALVAASMLSVAWGLARATRSVRRLVSQGTADGPDGSVIVPERGVVLAAAGVSRPRVVVSTGALLALDDEELAAGLAHEQAHITRRHRWILLYAEACRGLSVFFPGARHAVRHLSHHLERDADAWALRRHDRLALAGAICKATIGSRSTVAFVQLTGDVGARERVEELLASHPAPSSVRLLGVRACAAGVLMLAIGLALTLPVAVAQASTGGAPMLRHCLG